MTTVPLIEKAFAYRIASIYVEIYRKGGYEEANAYLTFITGGDDQVRDIIIPIIVQLGEKK